MSVPNQADRRAQVFKPDLLHVKMHFSGPDPIVERLLSIMRNHLFQFSDHKPEQPWCSRVWSQNQSSGSV